LRARALDVLGTSRVILGDVEGLDDSRRAIALAREHNAFAQLLAAELNLYESEFFLGNLAAASDALDAARRDGESFGMAMEVRWVRTYEAHEAVLLGRWDAAIGILDQLIGDAEAGRTYYLEPACRALRASIAFARGDLEDAATDSLKSLDPARQTKDAQLLAPALALRAIVLLAQGQREEASRLAAEVLAQESMPLDALLSGPSAATPIELSWLLRDLGSEAELLVALESAPSTAWFQAAKAIAAGEFAQAVELVQHLGAPWVEAYTRLRVAQELAGAGQREEAAECVAPALPFFEKVGARRCLGQAEELRSA
jgi:tetratricopeptide (TPR) repeat protein